ncbi:large ribosomal subunit protein uL15-like [Porites lutea]|uniref:large ribosomal subunit protein uL15-like n=1 Tax=Porites lutea TaxID=51062 RepID=UPI003CC695BD
MASCHIKNNLAALRQLPRVALNNIRDLPDAFITKQRKGRGPGSGRGKTSGRGHKGQGQRNTKPRLGFEGGNTPFYLAVPKHGFKNTKQKFFSPLNLNRLQFFIDSGRLNPKEPITMYHLWRSGAVGGRIKDGVKLLGTGKTWFQANVDIEVSQASKTAIEAIEKQGGKITCAHYNRLGLRVLLKPEKFEGRPIPRRARPPNKLMEYYTNPKNRGYLADPVELEKARNVNRLHNEVD